MKKLIITSIALSILFIVAYLLFWLPSTSKKAIHMIPSDAALVVTSTEPLKSWQRFSQSAMWSHLKQSTELAYFTEEANSLDSLISQNDWLGLFGEQTFYLSTHSYAGGNQYLYLVDLGKSANIALLNNYLQSLLGTDDYRVTTRKISGYEITELYFKADRETLYFVFIDNILVASYSPELIEKSVKQSLNNTYNQPLMEVTDLAGTKGLFRVYINYHTFGNYLSHYLDLGNSLDWLPTTLNYSGLAIEMEGSINKLTGYTNYSQSGNPYIQALHKSGMAEHDFLEIVPKESPYFISLGFKNMNYFIEQMEAGMQKDTATFERYQKELSTIEKFLDIDIHDDLFDWMGSEVVIFQSASTANSGKNQLSFMVEINDTEKAKLSMERIQKQIKKKTPVKIQSLAYQNYQIQYLAMKGVFKPFFGNMFNKLDKPYYAIIDNWIVFSGHPQSIKQVIDNYLNGDVLSNSPSFNAYYQQLAPKSAAFCYVNMPKVFQQLQSIANPVQQKAIEENEAYIKSFKNVSFQLLHEGQTFETLMNWEYTIYEPTHGQVEFLSQKASSQSSIKVASYLAEMEKIDQVVIENLEDKRYKVYYPDGELQYEFRLRNGWKDGSFESYYPNGETKFKGKYDKDLKDGTWKLYNISGELIRKYEFEAGKLIIESN